MQLILSQLSIKKCWKSHLKTICRRNKINPTIAGAFTILKFKRFFEKINVMEIPNKLRMKSKVWLENELKAYQWFLVVMSSSRNMLIQNYGQTQWKQLSAIFNKQASILEYEAIRLIKQRSMTKRSWEDEQINILQKIIKEDLSNNKWNQIARRLFDLSQRRYFRTGKQCRQRWLNYLDPIKKHGQWTSTEDRKIIEFVVTNGRRWSEISKILGNQRTQHMVKNRFKTLAIMLKKKFKDVRSQQELLQRYLEESQQNKLQQMSVLEIMVEESDEDKNVLIISSDRQQEQQNEFFEKYLIIRDDGNQVMTPPAIIYQSFTPTFLNTPNSLTFLMNYNFDHFQRNQHLFLKSN